MKRAICVIGGFIVMVVSTMIYVYTMIEWLIPIAFVGTVLMAIGIVLIMEEMFNENKWFS